MADLITLIEGAALAKFVGPAAEHYGKVALERAQQVGNKAMTMLAAVGRKPRPVEPKLLLPLVQAAALETDETLADKWAALLANAADSESNVLIKPAFIEILKQLTAEEALLLSKLFEEADVLNRVVNINPEGMEPAHRKERTIDARLKLLQERIAFTNKGGAVPYSAGELIRIQEFDSMIDGLLRQQVVVSATSLKPFIGGSSSADSYRPKTTEVYFSSLGYDFMLAVTPPTSTPAAA